MATKKPNAAEIRQQITNQMVEAMDKGKIPWRQPWSAHPATGHPMNFHSSRRYSGINTMILIFTNLAKGYKSKYWGTAASWKKHTGAYIKKGEHSTPITLFRMLAKKEGGKPVFNKEGKPVMFPMMRFFPVFNVEQLNVEKPDIAEKVQKYLVSGDVVLNTEPNYEPAEQLIKATGATIYEGQQDTEENAMNSLLGAIGDRAAYNIPGDYIMIPSRRSFETIADFYETTFHELAHWTEKADRVGKKEDHKYAWGELVAEISACFLMAELQVPMAEKLLANSQNYVATWLEAMKKDPKFIFDASSQASKVVDYLLAFVGRQNPEYLEETDEDVDKAA